MAELQSDADWASLVDYLRRETPLRLLNGIEAHEVFRKLRQLGYVIQRPASHPSGIETTEEAITEVVTAPNFSRIHADPVTGKRFRK